MPTLILLTIAYQIQNIKWRYLFLLLTAISFVANFYHEMWLQEIYSIVVAMLLFMLTPDFARWWQKRNDRNNPVSFWNFAKETMLLAKYNKYKLFFWVVFLTVSITAICFYTGYTNEALLGSLLVVFILIYGLKNLFSLILPPEWFLHDVSTEYTFFTVFIAYWLADLITQKLGFEFLLPMLLAATLCLAGFFLVQKNNRYLIPGCALILADILWQLLRLIQNNDTYTHSFITTVIVLVLAMLIGLLWLIKKPGVFPIVYLALFQLFRFSTFTYEATDHAISNDLSLSEASDYILYLVCWMYIVPMLFWIVGLKQLQYGGTSVEHHADREKKRFENFKKRLNNK